MNVHRLHTMDIGAAREKPSLRQQPLPEPEYAANHAWREGWWQGIAVGLVLGLGLAVLLAGHL